jgi:hypothetical protein
MSDDENGKSSERGTPKASPTVKEHARKMLAKLRAKLSGTHARSLTYGSWTLSRSRQHRLLNLIRHALLRPAKEAFGTFRGSRHANKNTKCTTIVGGFG